jgi:outer membrane protein TolC
MTAESVLTAEVELSRAEAALAVARAAYRTLTGGSDVALAAADAWWPLVGGVG